MSQPLRLAMVTRRFWPQIGSEESELAELALALRRQGVEVQVVSAQWAPSWPTEFCYRELSVVRLPKSPRIGWGMLRYMMALSRWLREHEQALDLVYVSRLQHEAHTAVGALAGSRVPVVLRCVGSGAGGDCQWQQRVRFGTRMRRRCQQADAVVAPGEQGLQELAEAGYEMRRAYQIPYGVAPIAGDEPRPRDAESRRAARLSVAAGNSDLNVRGDAPLAVYCGRLARCKGLFDLVRAWRTVNDVRPDARLWLIGDGPDRDDLFDTINDYELRGVVVMPGAFDDVQGVLQAADLFVAPAHEDSSGLGVLEAMAAGVPVVASDLSSHRELAGADRFAVLAPPHDARALAAAILDVWNRPTARDSLAGPTAAARRWVGQKRSIDAIAADHLELFQRLVAEKRRLP